MQEQYSYSEMYFRPGTLIRYKRLIEDRPLLGAVVSQRLDRERVTIYWLRQYAFGLVSEFEIHPELIVPVTEEEEAIYAMAGWLDGYERKQT